MADKRDFPYTDYGMIDAAALSSASGSIMLRAFFWVKQGWDADPIAAGVTSMAARDRTCIPVNTDVDLPADKGRCTAASRIKNTASPILNSINIGLRCYNQVHYLLQLY